MSNDMAERIANLKEVPGWRRSHATNEALAIIDALVKEREEAQDRANYAEGEIANERLKEKEIWIPLLEAAEKIGPHVVLSDNELAALEERIAKAREALK